VTRSEQMQRDFEYLAKARNSCFWIVSVEETRVERAIIESAPGHRYIPVAWDCAAGLRRLRDPETDGPGSDIWVDLDSSINDPMAILAKIRADKTRRMYILRDFHRHLESDPWTVRALRNLAIDLLNAPLPEARCIVIITPEGNPPAQIAPHAKTLDWPLPERAEIGNILDAICQQRPELGETLVNGARERAIDAAIGLTSQDAADTYALSIVKTRAAGTASIDPEIIAAEKKRVVARDKVLSWIDPDPRGLASVGGLDLYKAWLSERKAGLSKQARDYGLPAPKGTLLCGIPGCGKSAMAKAIGAAWQVPTVRIDFGALKDSLIGSSEARIRSALAIAEAIAPCVLWADEIEKSLAGAQGGHDAGVSADQLGTFLTWMQERKAPVFVIATANDVSQLPPELLRKGRFDELFFVDLPTRSERAAIVSTTLEHYGRPIADVNPETVAEQTDGFSGAEMAQLVPDAMFRAFADGQREVNTADLLYVAKRVSPLSRTMAEKIGALREWAKTRCRPASHRDENGASIGRELDI
jgi:AAA+ superfamily predicted ATPase